MAGRNKGFLNLNRFKSSKAMKRQTKYRIRMGKDKAIAKKDMDRSKSFGGR